MAADRHHSITLPRNFMFHYTDGQGPRTPEPEPYLEEITQPPPPPRQTYRVRRRRAALPFTEDSYTQQLTHDNPIPTIEAPEYSDDSFGFPEPSPAQVEGFLAPAPILARLISPPKTPEAQMMRGPDGACELPRLWTDFASPAPGASISRPTSSCSGISDSSASSRDSRSSTYSYGGSCTSPEEDMSDPFLYPADNWKDSAMQSPFQGFQQRPAKKFKLRPENVWTEDMDNHLWMTYMRYLQDPTVTPFKMLPSTAPPLGVCHRVVREAKKTWKGHRTSSVNSGGFSPMQVSRSGSPDTIKPAKSGSNTPTAIAGRPYAKWPRSDSATRKRLRQLCKRKPSLSAHYQRLLHCRSPSPFQSSPQSGPEESRATTLSSPFPARDSSFSTRDMNVSLATSTASSMQLGNPLSQLASDATPRASDDDVFSQPPPRTSAHQKSQSLHIGLGIGNMLESSFVTMSQMTNMSSNPPSARTWHASSAPRLDPPLELHAPAPLPRSFKRRALHNLEDGGQVRESGARRNLLEELFGAPAKSSHRRVRSRGFSLGDMGEGARRLSSMFTPPSDEQTMANPTPSTIPWADVPDLSHLSPPLAQGQEPMRLGSPFGERSSNPYFNTFPRSFSPRGFEQPASFEQRFGAMPGDAPTKNSF